MHFSKLVTWTKNFTSLNKFFSDRSDTLHVGLQNAFGDFKLNKGIFLRSLFSRNIKSNFSFLPQVKSQRVSKQRFEKFGDPWQGNFERRVSKEICKCENSKNRVKYQKKDVFKKTSEVFLESKDFASSISVTELAVDKSTWNRKKDADAAGENAISLPDWWLGFWPKSF